MPNLTDYLLNIRDWVKDKCSFTNWCEAREESEYIWIPVFSMIFFAAFYFLLVNLYHAAVVMHHYNPPAHISIIYLLLTIIYVGFYAIVALLAQRDYIQPITDVSRDNWWVDIIIAIVITYISMVVINVIWAVGFHVEAAGANQQSIDQFTHTHGLVLLWLILMLVIFGPIAEEVFFRFILIGPSNFGQTQMNKTCRWLRIIVSCFLFVLLHSVDQINATNWNNFSSSMGTIEVVLRYIIMSIILTYVYVRNNDLRASISTHIGLNTISCLTLFAKELFL